MWEEERNAHLCDPVEAQETAQQLIDLMAKYDMLLALPKDLPTLQSTSTGNWTRPDNVFCTAHTVDLISLCDTKPRRRPPCTDHIPILTKLELEVPRTSQTVTRNFRETDWKEFRAKLDLLLDDLPPPMPITSETQFQKAAEDLTNTIKRTIEDIVPLSKQCPQAKRWWTKELTQLIKEKNKLSYQSYKMRGLDDHPVHAEHRRIHNKVKEELTKAKKNHWTAFLEELTQDSIYTANKYITTPYGDGGRTSIPVLRGAGTQGTIEDAITNDEKS